MATSETSQTSAIVRVHRRATAQACGNRLCLRRHVWASRCDCGWSRFYRKRWEAQKALRVFHWEDDQGGADD